MIFAETERLFLRKLERDELPRLVQLIGVWDVVRWLSVVPFPYMMQHAEEFYAETVESYHTDMPEFFALALKTDNLLIGGIGLHAPRSATFQPGEIEIGYWLAKNFWGRGLMSEAAKPALDIGFARHTTRSIGATTSTTNHASQKILAKIGLRNLGEKAREYSALRGEESIFRWLLTREDYEQGKTA